MRFMREYWMQKSTQATDVEYSRIRKNVTDAMNSGNRQVHHQEQWKIYPFTIQTIAMI